MAKQISIIHSWLIDPQEIVRKFRALPHLPVTDIVGQKLLYRSASCLDIREALDRGTDKLLAAKVVCHMYRAVALGLPMRPFRIGVDEEYRVHLINHNAKEDN